MDGTAILIADGARTYDQYGNEIVATDEREVFVQARGVYRNEFYNAAQSGLRPSLTLFISHRVDYEGETKLRYEGREYSVIRTDWYGDGVNLVCEERIHEQ